MKMREHYIKFTCDFNKTYYRQNQQYVGMFRKQLKQCNSIRKCKPNSSLVSQAKITNANKMLVTQSLCALLTPAQLLRNFVFRYVCSFSFNLDLFNPKRIASALAAFPPTNPQFQPVTPLPQHYEKRKLYYHMYSNARG